MRRCLISYSHKDASFVDRLADGLGAHVGIWVDRRKMQPGVPISTQLTAAVGSATYLLPVISRHSTTSGWVREEISLARTQNITVIPIRIDRAPVPPEIGNRLHVDFTGQGFPDAFKKLLAIIERDLVVEGRLNLKLLAHAGDAIVSFPDPFTAVVSSRSDAFANACFTLDEPLFILGYRRIAVDIRNAAASDFTGYSKKYPKMLKVEMNGKPVRTRSHADWVADDASYVIPRDGRLIFTIPVFIRQLGHLSKFEIVIGKARLRDFQLTVSIG